jgi:hypothetical protein
VGERLKENPHTKDDDIQVDVKQSVVILGGEGPRGWRNVPPATTPGTQPVSLMSATNCSCGAERRAAIRADQFDRGPAHEEDGGDVEECVHVVSCSTDRAGTPARARPSA